MTFCKRTLYKAALLLSFLTTSQAIYSQYLFLSRYHYWDYFDTQNPDINYRIDTAHYYTYTEDGIYTDKKELTSTYRKYKLLKTDPDIFRVTDYRADGTVIFRHNAVGGSQYKWIGEVKKYNKQGIVILETAFQKGLQEDGYYESGPRVYYHDNGQKNSETNTTYWQSNNYYSVTTTWVQKTINAWDSNGMQMVKDGNGYMVSDHKESWKNFDVQYRGKIKNGIYDSVLTGLHTDGRVYFRDEFETGKFIRGTSYDSAGNSYKYKDIEDRNAYTANDIKCTYAIMDNVPFRSHENSEGTEIDVTRMALRTAATCILRVETDSKNEVSKAYLIKGVNKEVDESIMHAVHFIRNLQKVKYRGQPIGAVYYVCLVFPY